MNPSLKICLLGLGEVGRTLAEDLRAHQLSAWDLRFADARSAPSAARRERGLASPENPCAAVRDAQIVISAVTAAQDEAAARSVAPGLRAGAFFVDLNSASPGMKQATAALIEAAGGRYVEAVVMSPIANKRIASPVLLGGPHARAFLPAAREIGFTGATVFADTIGPASATKMCRSVIIKGLEALLTESMLAARHYGVESTVLASLSDFFPGQDWRALSRLMISRGLLHGTRRAEEMREAAATVAQAGIEPLMSQACARRQDWSAQHAAALQYENLEEMLDAIRTEAAIAHKETVTC
jgi:3-hydroxyisobutyrate dehydrogenase-like beta-hydroxyacid dehydrogenase